MLLANTNENLISSSLRSRGSHLIDANDKILWPTAVASFSGGTLSSSNTSTLYIAEYLGRIWTLGVQINANLPRSSAHFNEVNRIDSQLALFLDVSDFTASQILRRRLSTVHDTLQTNLISVDGSPQLRVLDTNDNSIFFEVNF